MEDLEEGELEYESVGEFLAAIKKEFGGGEEESVKVAELKRLKQGGRAIEEFDNNTGGLEIKFIEPLINNAD